MFEEMVISSPNPKKTNKPWTVVGLLGHIDPHSPDLHRGASQDYDGDDAHRAPASATPPAASCCYSGGPRQAPGPFDGCRQAHAAEGHSS